MMMMMMMMTQILQICREIAQILEQSTGGAYDAFWHVDSWIYWPVSDFGLV